MDPRDPKPPADDAEPVSPSKALAGIGAAMPALLTFSCCVIAPLSVGGSPMHVVQEMGVSFYAVVLAGAGAAVTAAVLVFLAGLGKRVPSVFAVGVATLPWVVGLAGARYGMYVASSAVAFADPSNRSAIMAAGIAEASLAHLFGVMVSVGALLGVGLGFASAAIGQRAPEKKLVAGALGLLALPMLGAALWLFSIWGLQGPFAPVLVALLSVVVVAAAAAAVGKDEARHRSGALAVASVAALALAFVAAASAGATSALIEIFRALAFAAPDQRGMALANAAAEVMPYQTIAKYGLFLGLVPLLGLAVWAAMRVRPSPGRLAGALAVCLVLGVVPLLDRLVSSSGSDALAATSSSPFEAVAGFEPVDIQDEGDVVEPGAFVTPTGLVTAENPTRRVALSDREATRQVLAALPHTEGATGFDGPSPLGEQAIGTVGIAVDRRVEGASLSALFAAALNSELSAIHFVGIGGEPLGEETREAIEDGLPMLAFLAEPSPTTVLIRLPASVGPARLPLADEVVFAVVGASAEVTLAPVMGEGATVNLGFTGDPIESRLAQPGRGFAFLGVGEDATAQSYLMAASRAAALGFDVVATTDGPPALAAALGELTGVLGALSDTGIAEIDGGQFAEALEALEALGDSNGAGGLGLSGNGGTGGIAGFGNAGDLGEPARRERPVARVRLGTPTVRGALSVNLVQRVVRSRLGQIRQCYAQALDENSDLEGSLSLRLVIDSNGAVTSTNASEQPRGMTVVTRCVQNAARRFRFPSPAGGGIAIVEYELEFDTP